MKVTLKTQISYPRHSDKVFPAGATIDVPDEVGLDFIKRNIAEKPGTTPTAPAPPKEK